MTRPNVPPLTSPPPTLDFASTVLTRATLATTLLLLSTLPRNYAQESSVPHTVRDPKAELFQRRGDHLALERARDAFAAGHTVEGVSYLQQVLAGPADSFVTTADGIASAKHAAQEVLNELSPVDRRLYESQQVAAGTASLREAHETQDLNALREVSRRYPSIEPGFRALERLALIAFDRGDFGAAARLWCDLIDDPRYADQMPPALAARALIALRRTGQEDKAAEFKVRLGDRIGMAHGSASNVTSTQWSSPIGSTGRPATAIAGISAPAFPPAWRTEHTTTSHGLDELWSQNRAAEARPIATPTAAVVLDRLIVVRGPDAITAFERESGNVAWKFELGSAKSGESDSAVDLHELSRFEETHAANGVLGGLSTDGERLYFVDRVPERNQSLRVATRSPVPVYDQRSDGDAYNCLVALPIPKADTAELAPAWTLGGAALPRGSHPLAEHYFFGPPVAAGDCLLVVTERQQQLNLIAIDPDRGSPVWQQPLGYVPRPVAGERPRAVTPTQPAVCNGIAVCGTNAGFVVAVDIATGRLLWAYDYASEDCARETASDTTNDRPSNFGDSSIVSPIIARGRSVVFLPADSPRVHCLDLDSGRPRWTASREDGLYVACVDDRAALVAGRSHCRSLSIISGSVQWSIRLGAPAGTGIVTDSLFLAPLQSGVIAAVELATGRRVGFETPRRESDFLPIVSDQANDGRETWRPGNLVADADAIYSVTAFEVARLTTAGRRLTESRNGAEPRLSNLETARIELAAGKLDDAQTSLEAMLIDAKDHHERMEAKRLLRELHYLRLPRQQESEVTATLAELDRLSETPDCRGRFLLEAVERELSFDDASAASRRLQEFSRLQLESPLPVPQEETHLVTVAAWMPAVLKRLDVDSLGPSVSEAAIPTLDSEALCRLLLCRSNDATAAQIRLELARRAIGEGDYHRAEMQLLRAGRDGRAAEEVSGELMLLRDRCGIDAPPRRVDSDCRILGNVRVTGKLWDTADDRLCKAFGRSRRGFQTRFQDLRIVDRGDSRNASLAIIDLDKGICRGEFSVAARLRFPSINRQPAAGHFVPVATVDRLYGVSMLDSASGQPAWEIDLPGRDGLLPQLGPYGPSFCSVQTRRELSVIDPATGDMLWRRIELPPDRGLNSDHSAGLFGDEKALTMLDADGVSYHVYRTVTGEELSRGRLPIDHRRQRKAYGRKLFFVESKEAHSVARLWDPANSSDDWNMPFRGKMLQTSTRDDLLALLFDGGRLLILDPQTAEPLIDVELGTYAVDAHTIQVFADAERFYVALYRADPTRFEDERQANYVYDTPLTTTHVQGRLIAIDRRSEEILWSRPTEQRSILDPIEHPLPFLVAIARISDRRDGNRKTFLVEVIDKTSGCTLGMNDRLLPDQLLQVQADPLNGTIEISGSTSTITLDFDREAPPSAVASLPPQE